MGLGRRRWPACEKDAPRPSPNQSLVSRTEGLVSVLRVTDDCDEKGPASSCGNGNAHGVAHLESREPWGTRYRIMGAWRRVSAKHLPAYLDEMTWRFNNRKNPFLFRDTMLKLIHCENLEYKELTKAA